ncbi:hypothetical protein V1515DRAFT_596193 [Lipomyces mesembrius]
MQLIVVACGPLVHKSAAVRQLFREQFRGLYFAKKGILPSSTIPVLMMYYNALLATLCSRAMLNLEYLIVFFVQCMCGIICLEKVIHGGVPNVVWGFQNPGLVHRVDCLLIYECRS